MRWGNEVSGVAHPPRSMLSFSSVRTGSGGNTEEKGSSGIELSKVGDVSTVTMARANPSLNGQPVDSGV